MKKMMTLGLALILVMVTMVTAFAGCAAHPNAAEKLLRTYSTYQSLGATYHSETIHSVLQCTACTRTVDRITATRTAPHIWESTLEGPARCPACGEKK